MTFITVSRGGPSPENDIPDGPYPLILTDISDPRPVQATRGPNAGKEIELIDWTWRVNWTGSPYDGREVPSSTSTASGPKSKMYAYLTALYGGTPPAVNAQFSKSDLIGRQVLGTVNHDEDGGWLRLANISALPAQMMQQGFAAATGAPVAVPAPAVAPPVQIPVGAAAGANADDLPF